VILADTSAWVEFLRATGSPRTPAASFPSREAPEVATTEVVVMELLAGATLNGEVARLRRLLGRFDLLPVEGLADHEAAAELYRRCRRRGETVRKLSDCLIAAVAIRVDTPVLHCDQGIDLLARHPPLQVVG
jgi:predicted nucleic acid-binding protein